MKHYMKEIKKNLWKRYCEPESQDYALIIVVAMLIGLAINLLVKGGF